MNTNSERQRREQVVSRTGVALECQRVYMPAESFDELRALCYMQGRSGSQVIESLISLAYRSSQKSTL